MAAPPPPLDPLIGRVLADRYRIVARIGAGGMGVVYRAWDGPGDRYVVVKIPAERAREPEVFLARFAREMEVLRRIDHPHVVPIIDDGTCDGRPFAVMPYLAGGNLSLRRPRRDGAIQPASAALLHRWLPEVAAALDHVHALGFVHRDVKPDNILFDGHGRPMVGDFGLARVSDDLVATDPSLTDTGTVLGTPDYMDPHVLQGGAPVAAGDQYALAVVVYELLAGRRPIVGDTPAARMIAQVTQEPRRLHGARPDLPRSVGDAVHRGLAKKAGARFPNCAAFATAVLAEIAPPPALQQRRLMCPGCQVLIASDDRHGGKLGSCPQCRSPVWIAPDLLALVIPVDSQPVSSGTGEPESTSPGAPAPSAEPLEPAPASEPLARAGRTATVLQGIRSWWAVAAGGGIAAATIGLTTISSHEEKVRQGAPPPVEGAAIEATPAVENPVIAATPEPGLALAASRPTGVEGLSVSPPSGATPAMVTNDDPGIADTPARKSEPEPPALAAATPAAATPAANVLPTETPAHDVPAPADQQPGGPPRVGAVAIARADVLAREIDPLFQEWTDRVEVIQEYEKKYGVARPEYETCVRKLNKLSREIAEYMTRAHQLEGQVQQARRANDTARFEALLGEQAFQLQQAAGLRPAQIATNQEVLEKRQDLDALNAEIALHYSTIVMTLPRWIDIVGPFDREERSAEILSLIDERRRAAELRFDAPLNRVIHLEARVVHLHLTALTAGLAEVERGTSDLIDLIEGSDRFLLDRQVLPADRRRLLHFHRLHTAYTAFLVLSTSDRFSEKLDDWLLIQDEKIVSRQAGFALRGLHALALGKLTTAAKHFDTFLSERPETIETTFIARRPPGGGDFAGQQRYVAAIDDGLNDALHGEIAWFFAAAPPPHAAPAKARELIGAVVGRNPPWQALRAEAALLAQDNRWDDALATLARAEQRAPLFMAEEIGVQREAYENRRPYTLSRKR